MKQTIPPHYARLLRTNRANDKSHAYDVGDETPKTVNKHGPRHQPKRKKK